MATEIERRWLVKQVPEDWLAQTSASDIRQGYLIAEEQRSLRIRARDGAFEMTSKLGQGLRREEHNHSIDETLFDMLWPLTDRLRIEKTRHTRRHGDTMYELDIFAADLAPLIVLEVEFASETAAADFEPPAFASREITDDGRFTNAALSRHGLPDNWRQLLD